MIIATEGLLQNNKKTYLYHEGIDIKNKNYS